MSTTPEKYKAVCRAARFLERMMYAKKVTEEDQQTARSIMRHYPGIIESFHIFEGMEKGRLEPDAWKHLASERDRERMKQ